MSDTFSDLYKEFLSYLDKGDEAGARKFLTDNLNKFPQEVQEKLVFSFFEEALSKETKGVKEIAEMQKEGLDVISQIGKAKKTLQDQIKIKNLKAKLTQ